MRERLIIDDELETMSYRRQWTTKDDAGSQYYLSPFNIVCTSDKRSYPIDRLVL